MIPPNLTHLERMLIKHEGLELKVYVCTAGKQTIGVGHNLEDVALPAAMAEYLEKYGIITEEMAIQLLRRDVVRCLLDANKFNWFKYLDDVRQDVVAMMVFNLGLNRFKGFKKMIGYLMIKDYKHAAKEMLQSKWAEQVGKRSEDLAQMMVTGLYPKKF